MRRSGQTPEVGAAVAFDDGHHRAIRAERDRWEHAGAGTGVGKRGDDLASAARKTALMVGSRAREALLGYPFPAADTGPTTPYAGEEPAPGQTVVLVGDDVEAWVRERLYGGRLPSR